MKPVDYTFIETEEQADQCIDELKSMLTELKNNETLKFKDFIKDRVLVCIHLIKRAKKMQDDIFWFQASKVFYWIKLFFKENNKLTVSDLLVSLDKGDILHYFEKLQTHMNDEEYWSLLSMAYIQSDYNKTSYTKLKTLFLSKRPKREKLMTDEEYEFFNSLPEVIKIYRAMSVKESKSGKYRMSWTLDKETAEFFKDRFFGTYGEMVIKDLEVPKSKCLAYFNQREESEIIYIHK